MKDEIATLVQPVISHALSLKERLEAGEQLDIDQEQSELKRLLLSEAAARQWTDYGGEGVALDQSMIGGRSMAGGQRDSFMGIRYALVCWLDEIFILDSKWEQVWNDRKLETGLYGTNDRAWRFWEQARKAESRSGGDALEVYFLCVMLGFRGDLREEAEKLRSWVSAAQTRIAKSQEGEYPLPRELDPPVNVPPLRGREKLQQMVMVGGLVLLILIPFVAFFVIQQLGN